MICSLGLHLVGRMLAQPWLPGLGLQYQLERAGCYANTNRAPQMLRHFICACEVTVRTLLFFHIHSQMSSGHLRLRNGDFEKPFFHIWNRRRCLNAILNLWVKTGRWYFRMNDIHGGDSEDTEWLTVFSLFVLGGRHTEWMQIQDCFEQSLLSDSEQWHTRPTTRSFYCLCGHDDSNDMMFSTIAQLTSQLWCNGENRHPEWCRSVQASQMNVSERQSVISAIKGRERERRKSNARQVAPAAAAANPNRHQTFLWSAGTQSGRRKASVGPADGQNSPTHAATWDPVLPAGQHATRLPQGNYIYAHTYT